MTRSWLIAYFAMITAFFFVGLVVGGLNGGFVSSGALVIGTTFGFRWSQQEALTGKDER